MWHLLERWEMGRREMGRRGRHRAATRTGRLPEPGLRAGTDLLPPIKHIVILMMENHSYDNYLGMLTGRGEGFPLDQDGQPAAFNTGADGESVRAFPLPSTVQRTGLPSQSWHASHRQWRDGTCEGFVASAEELLADVDAEVDRGPGAAAVGMGYWSERDLPFYYGLARTFPLADHWFSSCLGPTFPNRRFLIAGTAHGLIDDSPYDLFDYPPAGTIFDLLTEHGISWANYHPVASEQSRWRHYARHRMKMTRRHAMSAIRSIPVMSRVAEKDIKFTADVFPLGIGRYMEHVKGMDQFFTDAGNGTLPAFCIVDPDFDDYSEETPQDIRKGESFASEVINTVMHGSGWRHTVLIWLYDEHGGYYDHVPPPKAIPPDNITGRSLARGRARREAQIDEGPHTYDQYGFRVPAVIVSPYARPGYVCTEVFDHTSVLKLVESKWNLPPLTARDAAAIAPLSALDLTSTSEPAFLAPPSLPAPSLPWGSW